MSPGIGVLHQKLPHIVITPILDGGKNIRVWERTVGTQIVTIAPFFIALHCGLTAGTLRLASPKNQYGFALCIKYFFNKTVGGLDFQTISAPAKVFPGMGISTPNQIDPKSVIDERGQRFGYNREATRFGCSFHLI